MRASAFTEWDPNFFERSVMFEPLRAWAGEFGAGWPGRDDLQRVIDRREPPLRTAAGMPLRLVAAGRRRRALEEKHEARVRLRGELQVRDRNWHDLFNVLTWLAFPRAKAALNDRHYAALTQQGAARRSNRGPEQDALTLFDEGGIVVVSDDAELLALLQEWRWKELFWGQRARLAERMRFALFGHALYEKALRPFIGITARGILLRTGLATPAASQLAALDALVAEHISDPGRLSTTRELAVVPILGIPGWCADNAREDYYDNLDYFRPGRLREKRDS